MAAKKRRIRSPHPGVVLKRRVLPSGATAWRARFQDPDSGRTIYLTLDAVACSTAEARRLWAVQKSRVLARRWMELEAGGGQVEAHDVGAAIDAYLQSATARLRRGTLTTYGVAIETFRTWCARHDVEATNKISRARLAAFRDTLIGKTKLSAAKGGKRGAFASAGERRRSPVSINRELRTIKTLLNTWRRAGLVRLSSDDIADALKALPIPRELPTFLVPAQLQKLLAAAMRHDAATYDETREEHQGLGQRGTTRRYETIAPFVAFLLLTGCGRGEALALTWRDINLDALDAQGRMVGEIRLRAFRTKTHRARCGSS
jgi:integrase